MDVKVCENDKACFFDSFFVCSQAKKTGCGRMVWNMRVFLDVRFFLHFAALLGLKGRHLEHLILKENILWYFSLTLREGQ